jgi:hypothetical protein
MCASPVRKPGTIGRDEGLELVMPYFARMSRRYLDWSSDGAGRAIAGDVHAQDFGEVAKVLNLDPCTKLSLERCKPSGIVAGCGSVVHVK